MLNVVALYEHGENTRPHGSSYIRMLLPLHHPSVAGDLHVQFETGYRPADILLIDRTWTPHITRELAEQVVRFAKRDGTRLVYSLDDNLMDVNHSPYGRVFSDDQLDSVRYMASRADHVVVSTEPLQRRMRALNPNVSVIANHLDERLFPGLLPEISPADHIVVGYMGTPSHEADLLSILEPLRGLLTRYRDLVSLELVGVIEPARI
jgi:hypothetical protein